MKFFEFNNEAVEDLAKAGTIVIVLVCVLMLVYALQQIILGRTGCLNEPPVEQSQLEESNER